VSDSKHRVPHCSSDEIPAKSKNADSASPRTPKRPPFRARKPARRLAVIGDRPASEEDPQHLQFVYPTSETIIPGNRAADRKTRDLPRKRRAAFADARADVADDEMTAPPSKFFE
jgi:hypothetical protein